MWLPDAGTSVLRAEARPLEESPVPEPSLVLPGLPSLEHILIDNRQRQHVVLRGNGASLQLLITGTDVSVRPTAVTFLVPGLAAIRETCEHFVTLLRILSFAPVHRRSSFWTPTKTKLRAALVALDARAAGASHYDAAVFLHGIDYVERNWHTGLKRSMRHHLRRGFELSRGGYRKLLRAG